MPIIFRQILIFKFSKTELLEILDLKKRLEKIHQLIEKETSVLSVEKNTRKSKNQMEKTQREYYLNEQLKAIQKELGEIDEGKMNYHLYLKL